jgi:hypothetical protein
MRRSTTTAVKEVKKSQAAARRTVVRKLNEQEIAIVETGATEEAKEHCPVVRANQVFFAGKAEGRLRVVFF